MDVRRGWRYALAAALGMAAQGGVAWLDDRMVATPVALAQLAITATPGPVATALVGALHEWAMRLAVACGAAAVLAAGLVAGLTGRTTLAWLPWATGPFAALIAPALSGGPLTTIAPALLGAGSAGIAIAAWAPPAPSRSRRRLIVGSAALAALGAASGLALRTARSATLAVAGVPLPERASARAAPVFAPVADDPLVAQAGLAPDITPNADFYVVDESIVDPDIDVARWRLEVAGNVRRPFAVGYDDLLALPAIEQHQTLECISNPVGGPLIGNSTWVGVPVSVLIERAGPLDGTAKVLFRAVGGYSSAIPLDVAMDPGTIVAYGMGGTALTREHGFPARLLIPGRYGMKNVKWLSAIELVTDDRLGFWEARGWSDEAIVHTMSRLDAPGSHDRLSADSMIVIAGIAYAGARGVSGVEVSTDDRRSWTPARLGRRLADASWRRWALAWHPPKAGWYRISVRAIDERGVGQVEDEQEPLPLGATGLHTQQVEVR